MAKKQNKLVKEETLETILFNCRNSLRGRAANLYDIRAGDQHEEVVRVPRLEHGCGSNATTS